MGEMRTPAAGAGKRAEMAEGDGGRPPVTLSDDVVVLRPWITSDASFLSEASRDRAIERYNGAAPDSLADAISIIERIEERWRPFEVDGDPTGAAFAIVDAASGEPVGMRGVDCAARRPRRHVGVSVVACLRRSRIGSRAGPI